MEYFALLKEMPPGQVPRAVAAAIEHVGLGDRARAKLRTLSGGMLRRAGIAQAIVNEPELLLLDEPTAGLDPEQRMSFRALLRDLGERATVVVSTHLVEDVGAACTAVALMDAGEDRLPWHPGGADRPGRGQRSGGRCPAGARLQRGAHGGAVHPGGTGMTASTAAPVRHRPPHAAGAVPLSAARLLRIELRRNAMPWILPLIAALFWFDSYRPSTAQSPIWMLSTFWNMGQGHTIVDFGPFVAGVAAWMGSRDGRRGTADLVTATARPRFAAQLATWAATAIWAVGAYLVFVGVMFGVYAHQGVQGSPPWWWVAVGAAAVTAFSAVGFAVGAFFPGRFAAPLAAFGGFLVMIMSSQAGFRDTSGWALILPTNSNSNYEPASGIFYPYLPELPIARMMFLAGIAAVALGLLGLPASAGGLRLRRAAAVVTCAGVAAAGTAIGLAGTARLGPYGMVIPALHDAANDRPIRYTPVCGHAAGVPVCLNPAYRRYLPDVTAALRPVLGEVTGLPGAPARATQVAAIYSSGEGQGDQTVTISGRPPVFRMPLGAFDLPGSSAFSDSPVTTAQLADQLRVLCVHAFVGAGTGTGTSAQQAVQAALLQGAGMPFAAQPNALGIVGLGMAGPNGPRPAKGPVYTAAQRFAALPATARRTWLTAHLAALRSGRLTLGQLP